MAEDKNVEGLPQLESESNSNNSKSKKGSLLFLVVFVSILIIGGAGVYIALSEFGIFSSANKVATINEPPLPTLEVEDEYPIGGASQVQGEYPIGGASQGQGEYPIGGASQGQGEYPIGGASQGQGEYPIGGASQGQGEYPIGGAPQGQGEVYEVMMLQLQSMKGSIDKLYGYMQRNEQLFLELQEAIESKSSISSRESERLSNTLRDGLRTNERWLSGISNQLQGLGLDVKREIMEFPIIVYGKTVWGDDVYLTVAPKEKPDQTSNLRIGGIAGKWKLISLDGSKAIFKGVDGSEKVIEI
ncbi:hypothetical protein [Shewanella algae]|uniref:hypothetical protein n=2 Tax=Shewanella algae TaxID=38313 RepID=UPI001C587A0B|nr:hypothetical protein [Shewanella algae]